MEIPTGTVQVLVNGNPVANVALDVNGNGVWNWGGFGSPASLDVEGDYSGDSTFNPGSADVTEVIQEPTKKNVIVTITATPNPAPPNTPITVNVNVAST